MPDNTAVTDVPPILTGPLADAVTPVINATAPSAAMAANAINLGGKEQAGVFGDLFNNIIQNGSKLAQAFGMGQAAAGAGSVIAGQAADLGAKQSAATLASGQAGAQVAYNVAQAKANATDLDKQAISRLHLGIDDPQEQALLDTVSSNAQTFQQQTSKITEMRKTGFFDDPAQYLINHVVNIPYAEAAASRAANAATGAQEMIAEKTKALSSQSAIDAVMTSADTTKQAALIGTQATQAAVAASLEPMKAWLQTEKGGYELMASGANTMTGAAEGQNSGLAGAARVIGEANTAYYYGAAHDTQILELKAKGALLTQTLEDKQAENSRKELLTQATGGLYTTLGLTPPAAGQVGMLGKDVKAAQDELARNLLVSNGSLAYDPYTSYKLLSQSKLPVNIPPGQKNTLSVIGNIVQEETAKAAAATATRQIPPKGQELEEIVQNAVNKRVQDAQTFVSGNNPIFQVPSLNILMDRPWTANNPIVQAMRPMTTDGKGAPLTNVPTNFTSMIDTANELIAQKKLTENQAITHLQAIASGIQDDVQKTGGFKLFGIPLSNQFNVMVRNSGLNPMGTSNPVNMMDAGSLLKTMRLQASRKSANDLIEQSKFFPLN